MKLCTLANNSINPDTKLTHDECDVSLWAETHSQFETGLLMTHLCAWTLFVLFLYMCVCVCYKWKCIWGRFSLFSVTFFVFLFMFTLFLPFSLFNLKHCEVTRANSSSLISHHSFITLQRLCIHFIFLLPLSPPASLSSQLTFLWADLPPLRHRAKPGHTQLALLLTLSFNLHFPSNNQHISRCRDTKPQKI